MTEYALEVEQLVKTYTSRGKPEVRAVDGLTFSVPRGIIFGLLGPNGAGKSTLLRVLTTLTRPTSGSARVMNFDVVKKPLDVRRRISSVIQETAAELFLSVRDNLLTYARFQGVEQSVARRRAGLLIDEFQLGGEAEKKVQDLSGGFRRRVQVAKVFLVDTPVLFLDEFSTGMDPILKRQMMHRLRAEAEKGRTIILTTQILSEAEELCDDILIINKGREVARGDLSTLKLLSQGVYEIEMTFDRMPETMAADLSALRPVRSSIEGNSIEVTVKLREGNVMDVVTNLSRDRRVLHVEVRGATLEDIFVDLTAPSKARTEKDKERP